MQAVSKELDDMTMALGGIKLQLARERENNEELQIQVEILQAKHKVRISLFFMS